MTQIELARQWAATPIGYHKSASLFCDCSTIYSYTRAFPLAKIVDHGNAIMNDRRCPSQTTKRHFNMVREVLERARYNITVEAL